MVDDPKLEVPRADSENASGQTEWALRTELRVTIAQLDEQVARSAKLYADVIAREDEIKWLRSIITNLSTRRYK